MISLLKHATFCNFGTTMLYGRSIIPNHRKKSWLTPTDRVMRCVPPSHHHAVHSVGR